jgi:predicted amidophosphoribosyltransferase
MGIFDPVCIYCGKPLSKWERTRSYCWNCNELTTSEAFHEDDDDN